MSNHISTATNYISPSRFTDSNIFNTADTENQSYKFTEEELDSLALFFRKYENELPQNLAHFSRFVENYVYNKMTIAEVEAFFSKA